MTHPDDDTLVDLALGDPQGPEPSVARDHVAACVTCQHDVAQFRRAYGLRVRRRPCPCRRGQAGGEAPERIVRVVASPTPALVADQRGDRGAARGRRLGSRRPRAAARCRRPRSAEGAGDAPAVRTADTPDLANDGSEHGPSSAGARVVDAARPTPRSHRVLPWATGMAAAGLVIGLLTGRVLWTEPTPTTVAQVALDTLDTKQQRGEASLVNVGGGMGLKVSTTAPLSAGDGFLEVWLINSDGKRMVAVGVLRGDGPEVFPISRALISEGYVVVDISQEQFDDQPQHSGDSLLRGTLPA